MQNVSALAAQLESHALLTLPASLAFLLISVKADRSGNVWRVSVTNYSITGSVIVLVISICVISSCSKMMEEEYGH